MVPGVMEQGEEAAEASNPSSRPLDKAVTGIGLDDVIAVSSPAANESHSSQPVSMPHTTTEQSPSHPVTVCHRCLIQKTARQPGVHDQSSPCQTVFDEYLATKMKYLHRRLTRTVQYPSSGGNRDAAAAGAAGLGAGRLHQEEKEREGRGSPTSALYL